MTNQQLKEKLKQLREEWLLATTMEDTHGAKILSVRGKILKRIYDKRLKNTQSNLI